MRIAIGAIGARINHWNVSMKPDSQNIANAGEYYIASILSTNGFTTTITLGRAEKFDIIAISPKGRTIKLQVKTA